MKTLTLKQSVVAGFAALAIGGAALGVAGAQQTPTPPAPQQQQPRGQGPSGPARPGPDHHEQFIKTLAGKLGIGEDRLRQALQETRTELGIPERGPGGPGGFHGRGGPGGHPGPGLDDAARAIGISADQLRQELPGKSLAQVARDHNVQPDRVARALKDAANDRIDQAAQAGRIPNDRVSEAKQQAAQKIDAMIDRQVPAGGFPQRGPRQ